MLVGLGRFQGRSTKAVLCAYALSRAHLGDGSLRFVEEWTRIATSGIAIVQTPGQSIAQVRRSPVTTDRIVLLADRVDGL